MFGDGLLIRCTIHTIPQLRFLAT